MKANKPVSGHLANRNGIYHVVLEAYQGGKRKPLSRTTGLRVEDETALEKAQAKLDEYKKLYNELGLEAMLAAEEKNKHSSELLSDYMLACFRRRKDKLSPVTYDGYVRMVNGRIRKFFDPLHVTVAGLTPALMEDFLDWLARTGCNGSTQQRYYAVIHTAMKAAHRREIIERNPLSKVDRPKANKFTASYLTPSEASKLLELAKADVCFIAILLALTCGLRRSEVIGLRWSSIDFEHNLLHINHKAYMDKTSGKKRVKVSDTLKTASSNRTLPLIPFVRDELLRHRAQQEEYRKSLRGSYSTTWLDYVCVNPVGEIISPDYLTGHFGRFLKKNGLKKIRFHDLRHSCATLLLHKEVPMKEIQLILGHSNFSTTADIYAHVMPEALQKLPATMENLFASVFESKADGSSDIHQDLPPAA